MERATKAIQERSAVLSFVLERRLFIFRENVYHVPGEWLGSGNDSGDIGIFTNGGIGWVAIRFALLALLRFEALLFLPRSFFLTLEERLTTTIGQ
jgi:hypothetical protein